MGGKWAIQMGPIPAPARSTGGGDDGPSSSKTVVLNNGEMIEEVDGHNGCGGGI